MPPSLTPKTAADASSGNFLRLLLLGDPKSWKTSIVARGPGPVYFIKSDRGNSLRPALEFAKDFLFSEAFTRNEMEIALKLARKAAEDGSVKTVCWDTITGFSDPLAEECLAKESYAPAAWNSYHMYLSNVCNRWLNSPATSWSTPTTWISHRHRRMRKRKRQRRLFPGSGSPARMPSFRY